MAFEDAFQPYRNSLNCNEKNLSHGSCHYFKVPLLEKQKTGNCKGQNADLYRFCAYAGFQNIAGFCDIFKNYKSIETIVLTTI